MLLEKLATIQFTSRSKVLPVEGALPSFEVTAEAPGTIAVNSLATYQGRVRADGFLEGQCPNSGVGVTFES